MANPFFRDTLTIVTIPNYASFQKKVDYINLVKNTLQTKVIFVVNRPTPALSIFLRETIGASFLKNKITEGINTELSLYNCAGEPFSEAYSHICSLGTHEYFCCVDPDVLTFKSVFEMLGNLPIGRTVGCRLLGTKSIPYIPNNLELLSMQSEIQVRDMGDFPLNDFNNFKDIRYTLREYGVLLSRAEYLKAIGFFEEGLDCCFVNTPVKKASSTKYDVDYSHDLFTFKYNKES